MNSRERTAKRAADEDAEGGIGAGRVEKADAAPTGPAGDHADAASWGHGDRPLPDLGEGSPEYPRYRRHRTALSGVRQGDHRGLAAGGTGLGGVGGEGFGREAVEGFHMKSRTSSAFLLSVWAALSYSGDGRGVTGVTAPFFRERGGEAGRKEHRPDLEGKDTRRGAEKRETGGCLWAAAGFSHRGVGGLALIRSRHCVPWAWAPLLFFFCRACFWSCWLFLGIKSHLSSSIAWEKRSIPEKQPNCKKTQKDFRYSS